MFTYQLRERVFRIIDGGSLEFPNSAEITITMEPLQAFGASAEGGHTVVMESEVHFLYNVNVGSYSITSSISLEPLEVNIDEPDRRWELKGNKLRIFLNNCDSIVDLEEHILSLFYGLPILLNVEFADPPVIEQVEGAVGGTRFNWELARVELPFKTTTQESQESKFFDSWKRLQLLGDQGNSRLLGALQYFYIASRLKNAGHSPWEFTAEIILNLNKTLEALFPPLGDGQPRDAVRKGLSMLGYSSEDIERKFLPAMALRNVIDIGHVDLSLYSRRQLDALQNYTEFAKSAWGDMLQLLMDQIADGKYVLDQYVQSPADSIAARIIERIEKYFGQGVYRQN